MKSVVQSAGLSLVLLVGCNLTSRDVIAADAISVNAPNHSVSVHVDANGKVNVSASASSDASSESHDDEDKDDGADDGEASHGNDHHGDHRDNVQIGGDAKLEAGQTTHDLVAVMGSSTNEGDVLHDMVSVFGGSRTLGTVGHDSVAVFGNNYINGKVGHDVVSVFGDVELGPQADVGHEVVVVAGVLKRDPAAKVVGGVQQVGTGVGSFAWLHSWLHNCLFHARLLAFDSDVMWAWWIALIALLAYSLTALMFPRAVDQCVELIEEHPGHVVLTSLLTIVGIPMLMVLVAITIIGIAVLPVIGFALLIAGFFGKVVILAWIGRRFVKKSEDNVFSNPVVAVILGGVLVMLLYVVPVLSFIVYKVLGLLGLGAAVYALLIEIKSRREIKKGNFPGSGGSASSADLADKGPTGEAPQSAQPDLASASTAATIALNELPRAGFWIRMVALLIDVFLIGAITSIVIHPKWFGIDSDHVIVTLLAIYGAVMWKLKGATVGDIVFKLQVVRADGRPIDWPTAIIRSLGCFLSVMVIGLGFFWIAFDENKQAWHDKIAGTLVVNNPKGISLV